MRLPRSVWRVAARVLLLTGLTAPLAACDFLTGVPSVSRVDLTLPVTAIAPGERIQAAGLAIGRGGNAIPNSRRSVSYSSSNDSVATVGSTTGIVTGIAPGRVTISASSDGKRSSVELTVRPTPVRQVLISPRSPIIRLAPSVSVVLGAAVIDTNNQALSNRPPNWRSLDPTVATISAAGVVTPRALGTARIVASVDTGLAPNAGMVADTVTARITPTPVISLRITPSQPVIYTPNTLQFTATVTDSLQSPVTDRRVVWTSSNPAALSIDSLTGLATAIQPTGFGVQVSARVERVPGFPALGDETAAVVAQVLAPAASARVTGAGGAVVSTVTLARGATTNLAYTALDRNGSALGGRNFLVTSSNPAIVTADNVGLVTAQNAAGTATLTVQALDNAGNAQGTPATVTVTVGP